MGFANLNMGRSGLSVEHVAAGRHGVVVEAGFIHLHGDPNHLWALGGALSYRLHFGGATNAPFLGLRISAEQGWGRYVTDMEAVDRKADDVNVDLSLKQVSATAHVGYRWRLSRRGDLTFRLGAGPSRGSIEATETGPFVDEAVAFAVDRWARVPFIMDSELSIGVRLGRLPR
jgi:hypothetical protein